MKIQTINFLIALKNASILYKTKVFLKVTNQIYKIIKLLYETSLILSFEKKNNLNMACVYLTLESKKLLINLKIMTTGSLTTYIKYYDLCKLIIKHRVMILSTSKGFLSSTLAKQYKLGGKLLFIS